MKRVLVWFLFHLLAMCRIFTSEETLSWIRLILLGDRCCPVLCHRPLGTIPYALGLRILSSPAQ